MPGDPRPWFERGDTAVRDSLEGHRLGSIKLAAHLNRPGGDLLQISHAGVGPLLVPWKVRQVAVDLRNRDVDIDADLALPHVPNLLLDGGESPTGSQLRTSRVRAIPGVFLDCEQSWPRPHRHADLVVDVAHVGSKRGNRPSGPVFVNSG